MLFLKSFFAAALLLLTTSGWAMSYLADDMSSKGEITLETRFYDNDGKESTQDWGVAFFSRLETRYQNDEFAHVFRGMARIDRKDAGRNFVTIEDAYVSTRLIGGGKVMLLGGYKIFNWTATEAFHPADQINSRNYDGELENLEKKGELVVELEVPFFAGNLSFLFLPRFEEPKLPPASSRLGPGVALERPVVVDGDDATTNDRWVPQFGLYTRQYFSFGDMSFHVLRHINRNYPIIGTHDYGYVDIPISIFPPLFKTILTPLSMRPTPYYFETTQIGGTMELMLPIVTKIEWAWRMFDEKSAGILDLTRAPQNPLDGFPDDAIKKPVDHGEIAIGFEYPIDHDSGAETYLLLEFNTFVGVSKEERQSLSALQRDVFLGYRYAFNDFMGREIFLSTIVDLERTHERLFSVSYSQRLSDAWRIRTGIRVYDAKPKNEQRKQGLEMLDRADSFYLNLTRFF